MGEAMTDADRELLDEFVVEAREQLEQVEPDLLGLDPSGPLDNQVVNRIFRAVHSVKGAAGFFDLRVVNALAHAAESALMPVRDGALAADAALVDLLLAANDRLRALVDDVGHSNDADVSAQVRALEGWLARARGGAAPGAAGKTAAPEPAPAPAAEPAAAPAPAAAADVPTAAAAPPPAFSLDEATRERLLRHGRRLYRLRVDPKALTQKTGKPLAALIEKFRKVGEILHTAPVGPVLAGEDPAELVVYAATVLAPHMAPYGFDVPESWLTELPLKLEDDADPKPAPAAAPAPRAAVPAPAPAPAPVAASSPAPAPALAAAPAVSTPAPAPAPVAVSTPAPAPAAPIELPLRGRSAGDAERDASGGGANGGGAAGDGAGSRDETVRVKTSVLNALMEMAGEMVLGRNRLLRALDGQVEKVDGLGPILNQVSAITTSMQEQVMRTRLQPLGSAFGRFRRLVRDMSAKLGKDVALETTGEDVELDRTIIEGLSDPLVHLVRNCLDHGLEPPAEREAAGKPRRGRVRIAAYHEGGMVNLDVEDDGRGIDVERVKEKALQQGLFAAAELERMSDREACNLIFMPGFSTAKVVTDVSGRGVGMDVVRTNIEKLGGSVELSSTKGQGSCVSLKLPLTLAIVSSLIVEVERQRFALPQVGLEEVVRLKPGDSPGESRERIERVRGADVLRHRGKLLPVVRLADVLGLQRTFVDETTGERRPDRRQPIADRRAAPPAAAAPGEGGDERRRGSDRRRSQATVQRILVLRAGRHRFGLLVDRILDNEEIVVKPLSRFVHDCPSFSGATILGDGSIAMILDAAGLVKRANLRFDDLANDAHAESEAEQRRTLREQVPLVFFTAGTAETFCLPLAQVTRIEKVEVSDVRRVGSREYLSWQGASLPLARLDQLLPLSGVAEPTETLEVIIPKHEGAPFGIATARVIDAREIDLVVDRETIRWEGLLGSSLVDQDIVLLLDIHGFAALAGADRGAGCAVLPLGPTGPLRMLLADDTPFYRAAVESALARAGALVTAVGDGLEAWQRLSASPDGFDLVLTDLVMPALDGRGLLERIRKDARTAALPVVALTTSRAAAAEAADAGGVSFDAAAPRLEPGQIRRSIGAIADARWQLEAIA
jgi:two-component system chemotaxis sensor kinase CheA